MGVGFSIFAKRLIGFAAYHFRSRLISKGSRFTERGGLGFFAESVVRFRGVSCVSVSSCFFW